MPVEAPSAPPSSAPAAPVSPASTQAPSPPPSGPPIHVTEAAVVDKGPAQPPPKPGSAKDRMFAELRKKSGDEPETKPVVTEKKPGKPEVSEETRPETTTETPETTTGTQEQTIGQDKKQGKVSPWKLVDEHKAARLKAETEVAELRKSIGDPAKIKAIEEKAAAMEKRAQELENHIKFVDYSKSQEFQDQYQKPYEAAWEKAMSDLGELTVQDSATGQERPLSAQDILELVQMPLQKAREAAEQTFGSFADDVMASRKEIRGLFDKQQRAMEEAKKNASTMMEQNQKQNRERMESSSREIRELWTKSNQEAVTDKAYGKYFTPVEGDEEGNQRLAKGYEMADKAFSASPLDANLTADQRAGVVRLHAAVRNRSAAFGRVTYLNQQLEARVAELTAEIGKYRSAEPGAGERKAEPTTEGTATAKDSVMGALRKLAR